MNDTKYEVDRRYPFEATKDTVCPVPKETEGFVWFNNGDQSCRRTLDDLEWSDKTRKKITHFMVLEYPSEKYTVWFNVYKHSIRDTIQFSHPYNALDMANLSASDNRTACVKVEFEEGEGL